MDLVAEERAWRARTVRVVFVVLGVSVAVPGVPSALSTGQTWATALLVVAVPLCALGAIRGGDRRHYRPWARALLAFLFGVPLVGIAQIGPSPGMALAQTAFVALSALLVGPRAAWRALALVAATYGLAYAGGGLGWLPWPAAARFDWSTDGAWLRYLPNLVALTIATCLPPLVLVRRYERFTADRAATQRRLEREAATRATALAGLREAELSFAKAQRGQVIQRVGAAFAQEFNDALVVFRCSAEALGRAGATRDERAAAAGAILAMARRTSGVTRQIMRLARSGGEPQGVADAGLIVADVAALARQFLPADVHVEAAVRPGEVLAAADPGAIHQVLLTLVLNARDAMPGGGRLTLSGRVERGDGGGGRVLLEVEDDGCGMPDVVLARAFEPFFTTKRHGAGLGLASALALVRGAGGDLALASTPGRGTRALVTLPAAAPTAAPAAPGGRARSAAGAHALVVDPDAALRQVTARALEARGFCVLEAGDAQLALQQLRRLRDGLALLCVDVSEFTPGADQLAEECAELFPRAAQLAVGSFASNGAAVRRAGAFVAKPFVAAELAETAVALIGPGGRA